MLDNFVCWDCEKPWKENQKIHYVPSIQIPGATDDICNKCYSKRKQEHEK